MGKKLFDRFLNIFGASSDTNRLKYATGTLITIIISISIAILGVSISELNSVPLYISEDMLSKKKVLLR